MENYEQGTCDEYAEAMHMMMLYEELEKQGGKDENKNKNDNSNVVDLDGLCDYF